LQLRRPVHEREGEGPLLVARRLPRRHSVGVWVASAATLHPRPTLNFDPAAGTGAGRAPGENRGEWPDTAHATTRGRAAREVLEPA